MKRRIITNYGVESLGFCKRLGRFTLSIEVEDITDASNPKGIGSFDFVNRDRSGDQGFTDVSVGAVSYDRNNDTAHFPIKLQRGNSYRIYFKAEAYGAPLVSGLESSVRAKLATLGVSISDNMNEEIKQSISDLSDQITTHDQEIKQQLLEVKSDLAEIKRLLITPQGRREGFPIK